MATSPPLASHALSQAGKEIASARASGAAAPLCRRSMGLIGRRAFIGKVQAPIAAKGDSGFLILPFKPCLQFSSTRLTDGLPAAACIIRWIIWRSTIGWSKVLALCFDGLLASVPTSRGSGMPSRLPLATTTEAGPLPSSGFSCPPSLVLRAPRTPSRLPATSAFGLIRTVFALRPSGRVSPVPHIPFVACRRLYPGEVHSHSGFTGSCLLPSP